MHIREHIYEIIIFLKKTKTSTSQLKKTAEKRYMKSDSINIFQHNNIFKKKHVNYSSIHFCIQQTPKS